jgi:anti-sigma factor RsiW
LRSKVSLPPTDCARARESLSVQLDGELPETELDSLETHLRFCPECSAWAEQVRDVTQKLREASVEVPADAFVLRRHTRRWAVSGSVALASAAALVATMFFGTGQHGSMARHRLSASRLAGPEVQVVIRRPVVLDGRYTAVPVARDQGLLRPV